MADLDEMFAKEMVTHGLREFPNECCGVIAANGDGLPVKVFPMRNADASPVTYRLDGKEQLKVFQEIEGNGWELWGIFHSHTHSEAYPSETDVRLAFYPEARYVVVSLEDRDNPVIRSFFIRDGVIEEEELVIA
jgi:[CysO sulfur-carrier protein]-S-L-cysteine hydrolase